MCLLLLATARISFRVADQVPEFMCRIEPAAAGILVLRSENYDWPSALEVAESVYAFSSCWSPGDENAVRLHMSHQAANRPLRQLPVVSQHSSSFNDVFSRGKRFLGKIYWWETYVALKDVGNI